MRDYYLQTWYLQVTSRVAGAQSPCQNENFVNTSENLLKNRY